MLDLCGICASSIVGFANLTSICHHHLPLVWSTASTEELSATISPYFNPFSEARPVQGLVFSTPEDMGHGCPVRAPEGAAWGLASVEYYIISLVLPIRRTRYRTRAVHS